MHGFTFLGLLTWEAMLTNIMIVCQYKKMESYSQFWAEIAAVLEFLRYMPKQGLKYDFFLNGNVLVLFLRGDSLGYILDDGICL